METNEIIVNEEVMEIAEDVVTSNSGTNFAKFAGIGLAVVIGGIAYKYAVKPFLEKRKANKEIDEHDEREEDEIEEGIQSDIEDEE